MGRAVADLARELPSWLWIAIGVLLLLDLTLAVFAARTHARLRHMNASAARAEVAARTDPLTGLLNRRGFAERAASEVARATRYNRPLVVAFLDVRALKRINDRHGHAAGDRLLRAVGTMLADSVREHDLIGRLGGDEMAVLLVEQDMKGAVAFSRRLLSSVPELQRELGLNDWGLTVGLSFLPEDGATLDDLLAAADARLYASRGIQIEGEGAGANTA